MWGFFAPRSNFESSAMDQENSLSGLYKEIDPYRLASQPSPSFTFQQLMRHMWQGILGNKRVEWEFRTPVVEEPTTPQPLSQRLW
ncbi:hypothetical protein VNO77_18974 [Canavalia gladiata]|uniref:Uncharacterized protein n=1 Tax=Canavalia gladiata TaxID=3824 RepID=A0AAN9LLT2_CANGL